MAQPPQYRHSQLGKAASCRRADTYVSVLYNQASLSVTRKVVRFASLVDVDNGPAGMFVATVLGLSRPCVL